MTPEQEQQLGRCIFREVHDALFLVHPSDLRVVEANPAALRLTGFRRKQLVGRYLPELIQPEARRTLEDIIRACQTTSFLFAREGYLLQTEAGAQITVHITVSRIHLEPNPLALLVMRDLTRQKRLENELRESEEKYRHLVENVRDVVWSMSVSPNPIQSRLTFVSHHAGEVLGLYPEEFLADPSLWVQNIHPEDRLSAQEAFDRLLAGCVDVKRQYRFLHKTRGEYRWLEDQLVGRSDGEGRIREVIGVARDVTDRKQAEEERRRLESQMLLVQKLESLGVLAGGVAHDFNNLLTAILGYADLARIQIPSSSPAVTYLDHIILGARRAADLTNQMLAYSGKSRFVLRPITLTELVQQMADLLRVSLSKKAVLRWDLAPNLPLIEGDPTQLRQVVMNLLINASESLGDRSGSITIRTSLCNWPGGAMPESYPGGDLREGAYIHLEVSDTGCGMTAETRSRIFDPFFTTKFTGRGLGLAAVLGIVRGHHGLIRVRSMPGEGSTFDVFLPTFNGPSSSETVSASSRTWQGTGTVLVVDDEEPIRGMAEVMLGRMGFSVLLAEDGLAAIEKFQEHLAQIDLVLLDLTMPGLDGVETFRELRCLDPRVRVILSSGYGEDEAAKRLGNPKPAGFVAKPYELDSLRQVVRKVFEDGDS